MTMKLVYSSGTTNDYVLHMNKNEFSALKELLSTIDMEDIVAEAAKDIFDTSTHSSDDIAQRINEVLDCQKVHHFVTVVCK